MYICMYIVRVMGGVRGLYPYSKREKTSGAGDFFFKSF